MKNTDNPEINSHIYFNLINNQISQEQNKLISGHCYLIGWEYLQWKEKKKVVGSSRRSAVVNESD